MLQKLKDWLLLILLAIVSVLTAILMARKPQWVIEKEKKIEEREKVIEEKKKKANLLESDYKEMIQKHDKEIENAGKKPGKIDFDNPDTAASFIDDILSGNSE